MILRSWVLVCLALTGGIASAVTVGQVDDFEAGGAAGWRKGVSSNNQPTNSATGGPSGPDAEPPARVSAADRARDDRDGGLVRV